MRSWLRMTRPSLWALAMLGALGASGCEPKRVHHDAQASLAFRAAWAKRRAGDEAGYRAGMAEVARRRDTWAGERAALDLELADQADGDSMLGHFIRKAAEIVGDPSRLPGGIPGLPGLAPGTHAPRTPPDAPPPDDPAP